MEDGHLRENNPERAEAMADWSDEQHTRAEEMKKAGYEGEAKRLEGQAHLAERQAAVIYDTKKEIEGLSIEELRAKYREAADAENEYRSMQLQYGKKDLSDDVVYIQYGSRRAVIEKTLHDKERESGI